ncbi:hypothetical protein AC1031_009014 [Aphanomyces cochlioides]|nr:hypothetical protein AC1031_009014 [Aphanomyces cochlioides]
MDRDTGFLPRLLVEIQEDIVPILLIVEQQTHLVVAATACASATPIEDAEVAHIPRLGHSTQSDHNVHNSPKEFKVLEMKKARPKRRLRIDKVEQGGDAMSDGIRSHNGARDEKTIQENKESNTNTHATRIQAELDDYNGVEHDIFNLKRAAANEGVVDNHAVEIEKLKFKAVTRHKREVKSVVRREQEAIKKALLQISHENHAAETLEHDLKFKSHDDDDDDKLASHGKTKSFSNSTDKENKTSGNPTASVSITMSVVLGVVVATFLN